MIEKLSNASRFIKQKADGKGLNLPELALTLGSGLGNFAEKTVKLLEIPYGDIPGFPVSSVHGHKGKLILAT
ncbi:MAG TPA: purine-nucleoside phosphorylase, partial [bacterium]|nr:purine-nucleoside phosphorylase [bacterium]